MPEYGRNIQQMVEYALTIQDKEERTLCVQTIMQTMTNLFPYLRSEDSKHKIYDHLAVMSDFRLDIDSPYGIPNREEMTLRPEKPEVPTTPLRNKHYGRQIEKMILAALTQEDPDRRKALACLIAQRMMDNYRQWNKDEATPQHILDDLRRMSAGGLEIDVSEVTFMRQQPKVPAKTQKTAVGKKKKK